MRARLAFAGWPGAARAPAAGTSSSRNAEVDRQFRFLLRTLTPGTVFMQIAPAGCELSLRAASYVERVWCVDATVRVKRPPCNLRSSAIGGVPLGSIDVAFSERLENMLDVWNLLKPGGVWFIRGTLVPARALRSAGFSRVLYYAGNLPLPRRLARLSRSATTAAYK